MAHVTHNALLSYFQRLNLRTPPQPDEAQPSEENDDDEDDRDDDHEQFHPSPVDIRVVQIMLSRSFKLPVDLVDAIFEDAEYWARSVSVIDYQAAPGAHMIIRGSSATEDKFLLRSPPVGLTDVRAPETMPEEPYSTHEVAPRVRRRDCDAAYFRKLPPYPTPRLVRPARKVIFTIRSHDQGWGGGGGARGEYDGSWTWFEVGLERFDSTETDALETSRDANAEALLRTTILPVRALRPLHPQVRPSGQGGDSGDDEAGEDEYEYNHSLLPEPQWTIQRNLTAHGEIKEHTVVWSASDDVAPDSIDARDLEDKGRGSMTGNGSFVRGLEVGDVLTVWGKARFPGWANHVDYLKMEVYWAV